MIRKSIVILSLFLAFSFGARAQDKCNVYSEPSIGVTFCAPQDWIIKKKDGEPYIELFYKKNYQTNAHINIQVSTYAGTLSGYVDGASEYLVQNKEKLGFANIKVRSRSEFAADTKGIKVVYDVETNGFLRSIQYYFNGAGVSKIIVTATLPLLEADNLEKIVDASLKTFKIDNTPVKIRGCLKNQQSDFSDTL